MHEVPTSRRDVMCALAIAPAVMATTGAASAATGPTSTPTAEASAWDAAVQAEKAARSAMDKHYTDIVEPAYAAHDKGKVSWDIAMKIEDQTGPYNTAHARAVNALILTPAPHLQAVARKLELGIETYAFDSMNDEDGLIAAILADVRRLGGN